jgi:hypothetical protein
MIEVFEMLPALAPTHPLSPEERGYEAVKARVDV